MKGPKRERASKVSGTSVGSRACRPGRPCWDPGLCPDKQWKQQGFSQGMTTSHQCLGEVTLAARESVDGRQGARWPSCQGGRMGEGVREI